MTLQYSSLKPHGVKLFIEITLTTVAKKINKIELFFDLLTNNIISAGLASCIKKLNGLHVVPRS